MRSHLALLRGVNVGGRNKLAMADLRDAVSAVGGTDVATYIQSGNVVFNLDSDDDEAVAAAIEAEIARRSSVTCTAVVLRRERLAAVVAANPFPHEEDPKHLHVLFRRQVDAALTDEIAGAQQRALAKGSDDEVAVVGDAVYLRTPGGMGRSVLAAELARLPGAATARNWATVQRLMALLES